MPRIARPDEDGRPVMQLRRMMERELSAGDCSKRDALRAALVWAINSKTFPPASRLPPETTLAQELGVSLGTVQSSLRQVQDLGLIERRRGDGTRVSPGNSFGASVWHFRLFVIATGEPFRFQTQDIEIEHTTESGPWTRHLGVCENHLVIRRRLEGADGIVIGAEMVLDAGLVPPGSVLANEVRVANLRTLLEQKLRVRATRATHRISAATSEPHLMARFALPYTEALVKVEASTMLSDDRPFYFQTLILPGDRIAVEL